MQYGGFDQRCYKLLRRVPRGKVTTYGEIAAALDTRAARAVGQAMRRNPYAPEVPCHRVVCADGRIGGFALGTREKVALLRAEGIPVQRGRVLRMESYLYRF